MPAHPTITETNLPDQRGKIFIVTGSSAGIGKELAGILYAHNAKVYIAARSADKAAETIRSFKEQYPKSEGDLVFLKLNLDDLTTIKASAEEFLAKETRLDVLWNNAGVMLPPQGSKTKQNYELQLGTNVIAPFLFTKFLIPILTKTAQSSPAGSVRVVWVASSAARRFSPPGGVDLSNLDYKTDQSAWHKYGVSKAGNILHGKEFVKRYKDTGIISVPLDPGNLKTDLYKGVSRIQMLLINAFLKPPIYGAYTELYAGFSTDISLENSGTWVEPWGKIGPAHEDIELSSKSKTEGGTGVGEDFWTWTEEQVAPYL